VGPKVRFHLPEPLTLEEYRNQHALYKSDRSLQAAHAWHPFAVTWDDHELDNDYAAEHAEDRMPVQAFLSGARRRIRLTTSTCRCGPRHAPSDQT
jgi:phosphodiesterase/alkaline phosphatase D-like protein